MIVGTEANVQSFSIHDGDIWGQGPEALREYLKLVEVMGCRCSLFVLGDPADPASAVASLVHYPAGTRIPRHHHPCYRVEMVVTGQMKVGDDVFGPGDVRLSDPHEAYGPTEAGPEGAVALELLGSLNGVTGTVFVEEFDQEMAKAIQGACPTLVEQGWAGLEQAPLGEA